jgi:TRAP-type mannitol/chloroaromatic compound transport system permease small subunit
VEVISRYVFNQPTMWVWPINKQLFGVFILFAGIYAMQKDDHIRVEILYDLFPPKLKAVARWIALACFLIFIIALILQGSRMAWMSWTAKEKLSGAFRFPVYPLKMLIPIAALLFLLAGIVAFTKKKKRDH